MRGSQPVTARGFPNRCQNSKQAPPQDPADQWYSLDVDTASCATARYRNILISVFFVTLMLAFPFERMIKIMFNVAGWGNCLMVGSIHNSSEGVGVAADARGVLVTTEKWIIYVSVCVSDMGPLFACTRLKVDKPDGTKDMDVDTIPL